METIQLVSVLGMTYFVVASYLSIKSTLDGIAIGLKESNSLLANEDGSFRLWLALLMRGAILGAAIAMTFLPLPEWARIFANGLIWPLGGFTTVMYLGNQKLIRRKLERDAR